MSMPLLSVDEPKLGSMQSANFPMDKEGRTLHLNWKSGQVCNRIILVGSTSRAKSLASMLDKDTVHSFASTRSFLAFTGIKNGTPVSIVAVGMGFPNMDFVIRELRAIVDGDMILFRLGTAGSASAQSPSGVLAVATEGSISCYRDPDSFTSKDAFPYKFTKPVQADELLTQHVLSYLKEDRELVRSGIVEGLNCSCDSYYSSQGRCDPAFDDRNQGLLAQMLLKHPNVVSLEMESFHMFDLARCATQTMRTGAAALVLANRATNGFLDNETMKVTMQRACKVVLEAISTFPISPENLMKGDDCVWISKE